MNLGVKFVLKNTRINKIINENGKTIIEISYINLIIGILIFILGIWAFLFSPSEIIMHGNLLGFLIVILVGFGEIFIGFVPGA